MQLEVRAKRNVNTRFQLHTITLYSYFNNEVSVRSQESCVSAIADSRALLYTETKMNTS